MAEEGLFSSRRICIINSPQLDTALAESLSTTLQENGASEVVIHQPQTPVPAINTFDYIISTTIDFSGHDAACDGFIPVVKPQWVRVSLSKHKLLNPRQFNPDPRLFLNDVIVTCEDLPEGDKAAIIGGVLAMGGTYTSRITSSTTHLVTLVMTDKCKAAQKRGLITKIVLPHWFDDCLKLGKRIDERPYLLPNPEILRMGFKCPMPISQNKNIIGASTPEPNEIPDMTVSSGEPRKDLTVFKGKTVMISDDLDVATRTLSSIEQIILESGGKITSQVPESDIFVCRYREGDNYKLASRSGKDVGNLSWLYHLITHNAWTSPLRRLLHYPLARSGIPGFGEYKISLSNYAGEARIYLENLIAAAGAESTKTLKQENTHLLTGHGNSEKCTAAREWNLHIVNHLWLEESYARWREQTVTDPRYSHFPRGTNLSEVVGQTRIDRFAVEEHFFPAEQTPGPKKSPAVRKKDSKVSLNRPSKEAKTPVSGRKASNKLATETPANEPDSITKSAKKTKEKILQTPIPSRFIDIGKENETPSTTGSRKSKDIAAARLQSLAPDISLFEKESKRVGGVIYGGRRKADEVETVRKRSAEPSTSGSDTEEAVEAKKLKVSKQPISMRLLITGFTRWLDEPKLEGSERLRLRGFGISIVTDPSKCTHLVAPTIKRTLKFVNALAYAPMIINTNFITDCLEKETMLDPNKYILKDKASEKKFNFVLEDARQKAQTNKQKLLSGHTIYCEEKVNGGFEAFQSIIEANGGQCILYRGRSGTVISGRRGVTDAPNQGDAEDVFLISAVDKGSAKLWQKFRTMAQDARRVPRIVKTDWILDIALSQEWRSADSYEHPKEVE